MVAEPRKNIGWILFFGLFGVLAAMAVAKYFAHHTTYFDFGIFLTHLFRIAQGEWRRIIFGHVEPLLYLWSLLHWVFPENLLPVVVLSAQAAILAFPVIWLYNGYGIIPATAFALYYPLWYNALFDFHADHMAVILLFGFFFWVKSGRIGTAVILALLLALVKETFALQTAACGVYLLLIHRKRLAGTILIVTGLLYFYVITNYLHPYFNIAGRVEHFDGFAYSWLGHDIKDMVGFILTHPQVVLQEIISSREKRIYLFYAFGALGFIPLLRSGVLLVALPILALSLLSKASIHSSLMAHYTAGLIAPFVIAFAEGLPAAESLWAKAGLSKKWFNPLLLSGLVIVHILAGPSPIGRLFWFSDSWAYHVSAYLPTKRDKMINESIKANIQLVEGIKIASQNTLNWGRLAQGRYYFCFPDGTIEPVQVPDFLSSDRTLEGLWKFIVTGDKTETRWNKEWADYIALDLKRPWFLMDKGCDWRSGKCQNEEAAKKFIESMEKIKQSYDTVFEEDGFMILRRNQPTLIEPQNTAGG